MKRSGSADLPLHNGHVPKWLYERMARLGYAITEAIIAEYGVNAFLSRMSDPFWFQSLGAVMGMDWHSSGITTSVLGALKKSINPHALLHHGPGAIPAHHEAVEIKLEAILDSRIINFSYQFAGSYQRCSIHADFVAESQQLIRCGTRKLSLAAAEVKSQLRCMRVD